MGSIMVRQIIYLLFILILLHFSNASLLAQDTSIVSLSEGNKWYYNYSYHSQSPSGSESDHRIEIKEVLGDTVIYSIPYKKIFVISIGETNTLTRMLYWGLDSLQFYHRNVELLNSTDLNTYYDNRILSDTLNVNVYQQIFWGVNRNHQAWYGYYMGGGANIAEETRTAFGIGPVLIAQSGDVETGGISWSGSNTLFGALIDGVVYGDTNTVGIIWENNQLHHYFLSQNYPNPFNPTASIQYAVSSRQFVSLKVYDVLGNEIATLVNEEIPAGNYEVEFDAAGLPSGVYFYKLSAGDPSLNSGQSFVETKKMVLLR